MLDEFETHTVFVVVHLTARLIFPIHHTRVYVGYITSQSLVVVFDS